MIRHLVGRFKTERLESSGTSHTEVLDERLILPPLQNLVIDNGLSTTPSYVRLGMIRIGKITYLL